MKDIKLIELILAGKTQHFNTLVERYKDAAFGIALAKLGNVHSAEDVVQESFIRAYKNLDKLRNPERFASWLISIVRNTSFNKIRESKQYEKLHTQPYVTAESAEQKELHSFVKNALLTLSENNRETVTLYYIDGYSVKQVADFLNAPSGTILRRLHDSRKKLQKEVMKMLDKDLKKTAPKSRFVKKVSEISIYPRTEPEIEIQKMPPKKISISFREFYSFFIPLKCGSRVSFGFWDYPARKFTGYQIAWIEKRMVNFHGHKAYVVRSPGYTEKDKLKGETVFYVAIENGKKIYLGHKWYESTGELKTSEDFRDKEWDGTDVNPEDIKLSVTNVWEWLSLTKCKTYGKDTAVDGPWKVKLGEKTYHCLRKIEVLTKNKRGKKNYSYNILFEAFIDISTGRSILGRRYNGSLWTIKNTGKGYMSTGAVKRLKNGPTIVCDDEPFYLWYDTIPNHVFK